MRISVALCGFVVVLMLWLSACTTEQLVKICQNAGGRYTSLPDQVWIGFQYSSMIGTAPWPLRPDQSRSWVSRARMILSRISPHQSCRPCLSALLSGSRIATGAYTHFGEERKKQRTNDGKRYPPDPALSPRRRFSKLPGEAGGRYCERPRAAMSQTASTLSPRIA